MSDLVKLKDKITSPRFGIGQDEREVHRRALEIWQAREMTFPARVRRMKPDFIDSVSGAWDAVMAKARGELQVSP